MPTRKPPYQPPPPASPFHKVLASVVDCTPMSAEELKSIREEIGHALGRHVSVDDMVYLALKSRGMLFGYERNAYDVPAPVAALVRAARDNITSNPERYRMRLLELEVQLDQAEAARVHDQQLN